MMDLFLFIVLGCLLAALVISVFLLMTDTRIVIRLDAKRKGGQHGT